MACAAGTAFGFMTRKRRERQRLELYRRQKQVEHAEKWQAMLAASAEAKSNDAAPEYSIAA